MKGGGGGLILVVSPRFDRGVSTLIDAAVHAASPLRARSGRTEVAWKDDAEGSAAAEMRTAAAVRREKSVMACWMCPSLNELLDFSAAGPPVNPS